MIVTPELMVSAALKSISPHTLIVEACEVTGGSTFSVIFNLESLGEPGKTLLKFYY